jgi:uncharacterized protein YciI
MKFLNRCNGTSSNRKQLSKEAFNVYCATVADARAVFRKAAAEHEDSLRRGFTFEGHELYLGRRFLDDNTVLARIESALAHEAEFTADPFAWCMDALRDCASADHWYKFEKDYGTED